MGFTELFINVSLLAVILFHLVVWVKLILRFSKENKK